VSSVSAGSVADGLDAKTPLARLLALLVKGVTVVKVSLGTQPHALVWTMHCVREH
jgi:hypothetical protein